MKRGDVVLADFPSRTCPAANVRPAVVVQNDADNQALANTILAMITETWRMRDEPRTCWWIQRRPMEREAGCTGHP